MVTQERWTAAQQYERAYWTSQAEQIAQGAISQLEWYRWRANQLTERLERLGVRTPDSKTEAVLEVGSGPVGLAAFYPFQRAVLVDPLSDFYKEISHLVELRNPDAEYVSGRGEALPVETDTFDLAVIENCIDHVHDVTGVMNELIRTLKPGGILYLTVNCRSRAGFYVHRILSRLRLDPGHPHTFTPDRAAALVTKHGFSVIDVETGSYEKERAADLASDSSRARLKARLGISEYITSVIARKS